MVDPRPESARAADGSGSSPAALMLRVFGPPEIIGIGAESAAEIFAQPKRLALLAYLAVALPRGFRRRDELLALLWPESDTHRARNSLRQSLHVLRRRLPPGILVARGREDIGVAHERLHTDAGMFEDHLDHGRETDALALYRGQLLPGFHLAGCADFEGWVESERQRLRRRAVRGALVLAKRSALNADHSAAAEWARFATDCSPGDADVQRETRELLATLEDRATSAMPRPNPARQTPSGARLTLNGNSLVTAGRSPLSPNGANAAHGAAPSAFVRARPVSDEARRFYLDGRRLAAERSPATIGAALDAFARALRLSPDYAEAEAGLAFALSQATVYADYPGVDTWPRVRAHAERAIRLDPLVGDAHTALGFATICGDYDWTLAERLLRRSMELDPISAMSRQLYALYYLTAVGRTDEALGILDRARDSIPEGPGISVFCGMCCVVGGQFDRGLREADYVLATQPQYLQAHWVRGMALEGMGDLAAALAAFETGAALSRGSSLMLAQIGRASARSGQRERSEEILAELDRRAERGGPALYYSAEILAALGRIEPALDRLYAAYRQRSPLVVFSGVSFGLDPLRGEKRFRELLMRIGIGVAKRIALAGGTAVATGRG